jgi:RimJ/RimL family protein N-acetyltransferase
MTPPAAPTDPASASDPIDLTDPRFTAVLDLDDGRTVHLRPLVPTDDPAYRLFAASLSAESIYYRFFSPRNTLTEREIDHFLHVDYLDRFAVVAVDGDKIVGVGRYDRPHPVESSGATGDVSAAADAAEVAFVVADDYQGHGIAGEMLRVLARAARRNGITRFVASVLPDNHKMLQVFADSGWVVERHLEDGVIDIALALTRSGR